MVNNSTQKAKLSSKNSPAKPSLKPKPYNGKQPKPADYLPSIPQVPESEKAVIGLILLEPSQTPHIISRLKPIHFYSLSNRLTYEAIISIYARELTPDIALVTQELRDAGKLEEVGGGAYLGTLTEATTTRDVDSHISQILDAAIKRKALHKTNELLEKVNSGQISGSQLVAEMRASAEELAGISARTNGGMQHSVDGTIFNVNENGVYTIDNDSGARIWVCSPLYIEANTRDEHNENWGRLLRLPDRDGVLHTWAMPMDMLNGDGKEYRGELLKMGLQIGGRKGRTLLDTYLNVPTTQKALCVTRTGWHRGVFVFPDETIGQSENEPTYWQSPSIRQSLLKTSGTLAEWQKEISRYCEGNSRLAFAVSVAFASALLEIAEVEGGGFHIRGRSSKGKTTMQSVAGSVWGGGGNKGYLRRWKATINGLETVAALHNDALLCLDELGEVDPREAGEAAYMLANGQGKLRQQKSRATDLRPTLEWKLLFLSSGEISLADHIAQAGKRIRGGQEVRMIDIEAIVSDEKGIFEELHDKASGGELSQHLQQASVRYYGTPIREFLRRVIQEPEHIRTEAKNYIHSFLKDHKPADAPTEAGRVANRFALAAYAGELASDYGITGWVNREASNAAAKLFREWLDRKGSQGTEEDAAVNQVKAFLEKFGRSRFQSLEDKSFPSEHVAASSLNAPRAGFIKPNEQGGIVCYYVLPEVFRTEVCNGFPDPSFVAQALLKRSYLEPDKDRLQYQLRTPDGRYRTYRISTKIHEE